MNETTWLWAESLVHWLFSWSLVVSCVAVWMCVANVRRTGVRYAGWLVATFAGVVLLPAAVGIAPIVSWRDAFPQLFPNAQIETASNLSTEEAWIGLDPFLLDAGLDSNVDVAPEEMVAVEPSLMTGWSSRLAGMPWFRVLLMTWLMGVVLFMIRLARAGIAVRRLIAQSTLPVPDGLATQFESIRKQLGVRRRVRMAIHPTLASPLCSGIAGPTLLWPAAARDTMTVSQRRAALVHELAHLRRYDDVVQLAGELWRAICWFFVPIHWTLARLEREQEFLCDDLAAGTLDSMHSYAQLLLDHAPVRVVAPTLCSSFVGGSAMSDRIRRALRGELGSLPLSRHQLCLLLIVTTLLVISAGSVRLVGFVTRADAEEPKSPQVGKDVLESTVESADNLTLAERKAEAALRALGAEIHRDDDGQVLYFESQDARFRDEDIVHLTKLRWVRNQVERPSLLNADQTWTYPGLELINAQISDDGVKEIAQLAPFTLLKFRSNPNVTDKALVHIEPLTKLATLYFDYTPLTEVALESIRKLTSLRRLGIMGAKLTDEGLKKLFVLKDLEMLNLGHTPITDDGVEHLKQFTKLEWLGLTDTEITGAALKHLKDLTELRALYLGDCSEIGDDDLVNLQPFTELEQLMLDGTAITNDGLAYLRHFRHLRSLRLTDTDIDDGAISQLKELRSLEWVTLEGTDISDERVEELHKALPRCKIYYDGGTLEPLAVRLPASSQVSANSLSAPRAPSQQTNRAGEPQRLQVPLALTADVERKAETALKDRVTILEKNDNGEVTRLSVAPQFTDADFEHLAQLRWSSAASLVLDDAKITDIGLAQVKNLAQFEWLRIARNREVTDAGLEHLKGQTKLATLILHDVSNITDAGLGYLDGLTKLENLSLIGSRVTDDGLVHLQKLHRLKSLYLNSTEITDKGLLHLKPLANLQRIGLRDTKITNAGLEHLKDLKSVTQLALDETEINDDGLEFLKERMDFEQLWLDGTAVTDDGLKNLEGLAELVTLSLNETTITNAGLVHLQGLNRLSLLQMDATEVSDDGLQHLKGLKSLRRLRLLDCDVSDEGISELQKALPKCKIIYDGGTLEPLAANSPAKPRAVAETKPAATPSPGQAPRTTKPSSTLLARANAGDPRQEALDALEKLGAAITTVDSIPSWKAYIAKDSNGDVAQASLGFDMIGDDQLHYVEALDNPNFTRLLLWYNGRITDEGLAKHLRGFRNLQTLVLNGTAVTAKSLPLINEKAKLQVLVFPAMTDQGLEAISGLQQLNHLRVSGSAITDKGTKYLRRFPNLQNLYLAGTEITDASIENLLPLKQLKEIALGPNITSKGLNELAQLPKLSSLILSGDAITDEGLRVVSQMNKIRRLTIRGSNISDQGFRESLPELTRLKSLWLDGLVVTDASCSQLNNLVGLERLTLINLDIGDDTVSGFAELKNLRVLSLDGTEITDVGLAHLKKMQGLTQLSLKATDVTDEGLEHLRGLKNLKSLNLTQTAVSADGIRSLNEALPNCEIYFP